MAAVRMICLANSRKHSNRCIAGICTETGAWVRPVTKGGDGAVPRIIIDKEEPALLDIIEVPLLEGPAPDFGFQAENKLMGGGAWARTGRAIPAVLFRHCRITGPLLHNDRDRIPHGLLKLLPRPQWKSLDLVRAWNVAYYVKPTSKGKTQCRAVFRYGGKTFDLAVTDPIMEARIADGHRKSQDCLMTVSLGMPFPEDDPNPACFKLVAGIIEL
ncbi:MAG: hypothetical protein ACE15C_19000 [Phycisphaerae bacterium]